TDTNVRRIIKEFTRSLNDDEVNFLEDKLVLIERKENEMDLIDEVVDDRDLGCKVRIIKTDNFEIVFKKISSINQGISPSAVRKYQHVIKKLIIDRGKSGTLNTVLVSPEELDKIEDDLQNKNLTVAIGDSKYIFQIPDIISYSLDYISDEDEISSDIRLRFAVIQMSSAPNSRFPVNKILDRNLIKKSDLHSSEQQKLMQKINHYSNFEIHYAKINYSSVFNKNTNSLDEITNKKTKDVNIYETISYNITKLDLEEIKGYLIKELYKLKEKGEIKLNTQIRRLLLLYDILKNKRDNA